MCRLINTAFVATSPPSLTYNPAHQHLPLVHPNQKCSLHTLRMSARKARRSKRPRQSSNSSSGFSRDARPASEPTPPSLPKVEQPPTPSGPDLQKRDASGISLGDRLREEIAHPLRKPKLTLFVTLSFSALLGLFFALARSNKDAMSQVIQNVTVDITAITLFAWLAWREVQFGRRALNSLAGRPQARDLQVVMLDNVGSALASGKEKRIGDLQRGCDIVVLAGRSVDLRKYMARFENGIDGQDADNLVVFAMDATSEKTEEFHGVDAVASGEAEKAKDWIAWLGDAVPPRRNVALFRIEADDARLNSASSYVVAVGEPLLLPLPVDAKRELSEV